MDERCEEISRCLPFQYKVNAMHTSKLIIYREKPCSSTIAWLLVLWLYSSSIMALFSDAFSSSLPQLLSYAFRMTLLLYALFVLKIKVDVRALLLTLAILIYAMVSFYIVPNGNYYAVVIDTVSALAAWVPCVFLVTQDEFDIDVFASTWANAATRLSLLVFLSIICQFMGFITYGTTAHLAAPNALGLLIAYYMEKGEIGTGVSKRVVLLLLFNTASILFFGGRSFALSIVVAVFAVWALSGGSSVKRLGRIAVLALLTMILFYNLIPLLLFASDQLDKFGISSRNIDLLIQQINTSEIYLANRDVAYDLSLSLIDEAKGFPTGFGAVYSITGGDFYHPHNFLIQTALLFGVFGAALFIAVTLFKLVRLFLHPDSLSLHHCIAPLFLYLIPYSFFNGSLLSDPLEALAFSLLFFVSSATPLINKEVGR